MKEPARADSPVISIPGSCVQPFEQYEVAGHVSDALPVVWVRLRSPSSSRRLVSWPSFPRLLVSMSNSRMTASWIPYEISIHLQGADGLNSWYNQELLEVNLGNRALTKNKQILKYL